MSAMKTLLIQEISARDLGRAARASGHLRAPVIDAGFQELIRERGAPVARLAASWLLGWDRPLVVVSEEEVAA